MKTLQSRFVDRELCCGFNYRLQRSWAKVMFLQASVILSTGGGGCLPQCMRGYHPPPPRADQTPREQTPPEADTPQTRHPRTRHTPPEQTPPRDQTPPPPPGSRRQHTVNERPFRILLECILVNYCVNGTNHYMFTVPLPGAPSY